MPQRCRASAIACAAVLGLATGACSSNWFTPFRIEIQQGNFFTAETVAQVQPGMTREQVRFLLGTPLVTDPFRTNRWDYVFVRHQANFRGSEQRRVSVFFENDVVARIDGDVRPVVDGGGAARQP